MQRDQHCEKSGASAKKERRPRAIQFANYTRDLADAWKAGTKVDRVDLARWIIRDWGGIRRNSDAKIESYALNADATIPNTAFLGVSSYSKVLSIKDPDRYAIYDSRVAAALNAIQLAYALSGSASGSLMAFPYPSSQNKQIAAFCKQFGPKKLKQEFGFELVLNDDAYGYYMALLFEIERETKRAVLATEMQLFGGAETLCAMAQKLVTQRGSRAP